MNERIQELIKQATTRIDPAAHDGICWDFDKEKFAELIVKECAKIADVADENKCEWIGGNILTHFGVEK